MIGYVMVFLLVPRLRGIRNHFLVSREQTHRIKIDGVEIVRVVKRWRRRLPICIIFGRNFQELFTNVRLMASVRYLDGPSESMYRRITGGDLISLDLNEIRKKIP